MMTQFLPKLFLLLLSTLSSFLVSAQIKYTLFTQLVAVNKEWNNQPDANSNLRTTAATDLSEQALVRQHLQEVEKLLRSRTPKNLSEKQLQNRAKNLDVLHRYWQAGVFPINTQHSSRQPYFIDDNNTFCAVGYLMKESGAERMAREIHDKQNFNYLADIRHPGLMKWVENSGLTLQELALVQPAYGGEWPAAVVEMHYNNTGTDIGEYIEVHQTNYLPIGLFGTVRFYNGAGNLYKTLQLSDMQVVNGLFYYYSFPAGESFADSGKVVIFRSNGSVGFDTLSILTYNSAGITLKDFTNSTTRTFTTVESESTPVGSSLTFCGLYYAGWNTSILPATVGTVNPCTIGAMPLTLTSFEYQLNNKNVELNWKTSTESNTSHFEVERSSDGITYKAIGRVAAAGNSNTLKSYGFSDIQPAYINHYRLKQVDKDGTSSYSKILYVKYGKASLLTVMENPIGKSLRVQVNANASDLKSLTVYNAMGQMVLRKTPKAGIQQLDVAALPAGNYVLQLLTTDGRSFNQQFVK